MERIELKDSEVEILKKMFISKLNTPIINKDMEQIEELYDLYEKITGQELDIQKIFDDTIKQHNEFWGLFDCLKK